jgi:protein-disulfide isomerase
VTPELIKRYVDTGKVRFVYREFPLTSIHAAAQKASEAAVCAGKQDRYWNMNEKLFASQSEWSADGGDPVGFFRTYAAGLGLDVDAFNQCLDSGEAALDIQADQLAAQSLGVNATPYFFIDDLAIRGGLPIDMFGTVIDYVIAGGPEPQIIPATTDWHLLGNTQTAQGATVAFLNYADALSRQHVLEVFPQLRQTYVDTGQMIYVLHVLTPGQDTPSALAAAATECAGQQDKGWEMHTKLFEEQDAWSKAADPRPLFLSYAQGLSLDTTAFEQCLDSPDTALRVQQGNVVAAMYGVPETPVFLFSGGGGQQGSPTFEEFKEIIDPMLGQ